MSSLDSTLNVAERLRDAVSERLAADGRPVRRALVYPGDSPTWDDCCDSGADGEGFAAVSVDRVYPADPFPVEDSDAQRCGVREYGATFGVHVLRCAATVSASGAPPTVESIEADTVDVAADRESVAAAIGVVCDELDDPGGVTITDWTPLGPQGGCVGGVWRLTVAVPEP